MTINQYNAAEYAAQALQQLREVAAEYGGNRAADLITLVASALDDDEACAQLAAHPHISNPHIWQIIIGEGLPEYTPPQLHKIAAAAFILMLAMPQSPKSRDVYRAIVEDDEKCVKRWLGQDELTPTVLHAALALVTVTLRPDPGARDEAAAAMNYAIDDAKARQDVPRDQ